MHTQEDPRQVSAMDTSVVPRTLSEAFGRGYIERDELVRIFVGKTYFTFKAERLVRSSRISNDLTDVVVKRRKREYPRNLETPQLRYDRNSVLFQHVYNYLHDFNRWKSPDANINAQLLAEATYFGLDDMAAKLPSMDAHAATKRPYFRLEIGQSGVVDLPTAFGDDFHQIAQKYGKDVIISPNAPRVLLKLNGAQDIMDEFVVELIGRGYTLFAVNDLPDCSVYHFRT